MYHGAQAAGRPQSDSRRLGQAPLRSIIILLGITEYLFLCQRTNHGSNEKSTHVLQIIARRASQPTTHGRQYYGFLWIWIDAFCINQRDIDERNMQVKRMGSIYQRADMVCAWVGRQAEDSSIAIDLLKVTYEVARNTPEDNRREWLYLWVNERPKGCRHALFRFLSRPYWMRLW
jgi:hypothetical protein